MLPRPASLQPLARAARLLLQSSSTGLGQAQSALASSAPAACCSAALQQQLGAGPWPCCSSRGFAASANESQPSTSAASTSGSQADVSAQAFQHNPKAAAEDLAAKLSPAQRAILAAALAQHTQHQQVLDEKYFNELFSAHDVDADSKGALTRCDGCVGLWA